MIDRIIIAPHVDDEVIGAAASLGPDTLVFYVGVDDFHVVSKEKRFEEAVVSAQIGKYLIRFPYFETGSVASWISFHHGEFTVNYYHNRLNRLISEFETLFESEQPEEVLLPWPSYNQDHQTVYDASMIALRPHDINHFVKRVLLYEEPDCWWQPREPFVPNLYRRLDLGHKLNMYNAMPSQIRGHRSEGQIEALAVMRGAACGKIYAEAYHVARWVE